MQHGGYKFYVRPTGKNIISLTRAQVTYPLSGKHYYQLFLLAAYNWSPILEGLFCADTLSPWWGLNLALCVAPGTTQIQGQCAAINANIPGHLSRTTDGNLVSAVAKNTLVFIDWKIGGAWAPLASPTCLTPVCPYVFCSSMCERRRGKSGT